MKEIKQEKNRPASNIPYQGVNKPFRTLFIVPGPGVTIEQDANGVCYISAEGGAGVADLKAGDNIVLTKTDDGKIIISAVDTATDIAAGQNITIDIDPETGTAVINSITGGATNEHYQGVFDTAEDLIAFDTDPEIGDYGMIKQITYSDGGETTWNGQYKYCFFINGQWTVVDQMLTFTDDIELLQQFYSVGGSSPVIYLHKIAQTGSFRDLRDVPIVATPNLTVEGTTLTAACDTEGAELWYTTDGAMPHVNGNKYTGPITVTEATRFRFVGIKNGMINSLEATIGVDYELQPPTIDLDWHDGTITMANPNQSGEIYYTTDGSTPTNASNAYTGPFLITEATRFKLAVISNGLTSDVVEHYYQKLKVMGGVRNLNPANGVINVSPGNIGNEGNVVVSGTLKYTQDGDDPTFLSSDFINAVSLQNYGGTKTIKEKAFAEGYVPSDTRSSNYGELKPVSPPVLFDPETNTVSLCNTNVPASQGNVAHGLVSGLFGGPRGYVFYYPEGSTYSRIYYTLDGSTPTKQSTLYTGPFQISGNVTIKAVLVAYGQYDSDVTTYNVELMAAPQIALVDDNGTVELTNPNESGTIYYTTDGSTPTAASTTYTEPFTITGVNGATVKALVIDGSKESPISSETYPVTSASYMLSLLAPSINYATGTVTMTANRNTRTPAGSVIRYDLDGNVPTNNSPEYTGPVSFALFNSGNNPRHPLFRVFCAGYLPGASVGFANGIGYDKPSTPRIDFDVETNTVSFVLTGNTANIPLQTNNTVPSMGARIYYTTDGAIPSTDGSNATLWDGNTFQVSTETTIKVLVKCYGRYPSSYYQWTSPDYLCFEAVENNTGIHMVSNIENAPDLEYSTDGINFQKWNHITSVAVHTFEMITLKNAGDKVYFRGTNQALSDSNGGVHVSRFFASRKVYASGSVTALINKAVAMTAAIPMQRLFSGMPIITAPKLPSSDLTPWCYAGLFEQCYLLEEATNLPAANPPQGAYSGIFSGCKFLMSDDASTFNFTFRAKLPQTIGGVTYSTPRDIAEWMGNLCGFDYMVPESALADDVVARIFKDNKTGVLKYFPQDTYDESKFFADQYTEKDWMRQERNRDGITVMQRKTGIASAKYTEDNRYKLYCDTTANGGFTIETGSRGTVNTQTIAWNAGDTLDDIVTLFTSDPYVRFSHVQGEDFIRVLASQSSSSYDCTLSNNTGGTVVDLSKQCRIGGIAQAETHRVWQGTDLHTMFPDAGIPAANTVQYAKSGLNLSYRCGGNLTSYMNYYEVSGSGRGGVDTYLAEDALSARMSRIGFTSCNGSGNPDAQALYDKYEGSWEAYMEASMIDGESTNANGIVDQTCSVADTVSPYLASVETADFDGEWIPAFPIFYNAYQVVDVDFGHGIVGANHDMSVYMDVDTMTLLNSGGCNISRTSYYWSVAQYNAGSGWFFYGNNGTVRNNIKTDATSARVLAYIRPK